MCRFLWIFCVQNHFPLYIATGLFFFFLLNHYDFFFLLLSHCLQLPESSDERNPCFISGLKGRGFNYFTMKFDICYRLLTIFIGSVGVPFQSQLMHPFQRGNSVMSLPPERFHCALDSLKPPQRHYVLLVLSFATSVTFSFLRRPHSRGQGSSAGALPPTLDGFHSTVFISPSH